MKKWPTPARQPSRRRRLRAGSGICYLGRQNCVNTSQATVHAPEMKPSDDRSRILVGINALMDPLTSVMRNCSSRHGARRMAFRWLSRRPFVLSTKKAQNTRGSACAAIHRFITLAGSPLLGLFLLTGCAPVGIQRQRLVAKTNMTFSDSSVFTYNSPKLFLQLAPGFGASGGAQNSGCTSCR